ncbi:hypothetical protein VMF7928_02100 [Vibrio marisflavi CECT 7928]|uniref:Uncharacterized protein n=1 Tax=Vibrio marisflavi CECT 7928 TaxID=634439 RepID=A0ABN8E3G1_9VIBR|nr:hypothetical protein VMF7928_02100 [Vibrio marisflavi CECT 7928]
MQHQEMIQPTNFGLISKTVLFAILGIFAVLFVI